MQRAVRAALERDRSSSPGWVQRRCAARPQDGPARDARVAHRYRMPASTCMPRPSTPSPASSGQRQPRVRAFLEAAGSARPCKSTEQAPPALGAAARVAGAVGAREKRYQPLEGIDQAEAAIDRGLFRRVHSPSSSRAISLSTHEKTIDWPRTPGSEVGDLANVRARVYIRIDFPEPGRRRARLWSWPRA